MKSVLEKSGVLPDSSVGLDLTDIWLGVKTTLAVNPSIHCIRDPVNSRLRRELYLVKRVLVGGVRS